MTADTNDNPFEAPVEAGTVRLRRAPYFKSKLILWCYPLCFLSMVYGTWLIAWASLGHMPIPGRNDPKYINTLVSSLYTLTIVSVIGLPVMFLTALVYLPRLHSERWPVRILIAAWW